MKKKSGIKKRASADRAEMAVYFRQEAIVKIMRKKGMLKFDMSAEELRRNER